MLTHILNIAIITFKGGVRTKLFITIIVLAGIVFLVLVPSGSSLSMRQVREVATSLSLSLISFTLLVLTVFIGVNLIYRDIDNKVAISVLSLPISRTSYILGKYLGLVFILFLITVVLTILSIPGIVVSDSIYGYDLPVQWHKYITAIVMEFFKACIIGAFGVLFSSFATNVFLPLFGTIGVYIIGSISQAIYDYINSPYGEKLPEIAIIASKITYFIFPNLTAFDLKFKAIYNLTISYTHLGSLCLYGIFYTTIVLSIAVAAFSRREIL